MAESRPKKFFAKKPCFDVCRFYHLDGSMGPTLFNAFRAGIPRLKFAQSGPEFA